MVFRQPDWLMIHKGGVFCTYPQAFLTKASQFFSEFITATILMFVIFALEDESNRGAMGKTGTGPFFPLALFFLIFGLGACFGFETGYAIVLARDFGPRSMSYAVGYGHEVWSAGDYYFWSQSDFRKGPETSIRIQARPSVFAWFSSKS